MKYLYWFILITVLVSSMWTLLTVTALDGTRILVIAVTAGFYVLWGILYHKHLDDLHPRIIWEYLLIGVLSVILFGMLL